MKLKMVICCPVFIARPESSALEASRHRHTYFVRLVVGRVLEHERLHAITSILLSLVIEIADPANVPHPLRVSEVLGVDIRWIVSLRYFTRLKLFRLDPLAQNC